MSKKSAARNIHAITRGQQPRRKPGTLPAIIKIREGDATALDLRITQRNEAQVRLNAAEGAIGRIVADIAADAGITVQDLTTRYQFANGEFVLMPAQQPLTPEPPPSNEVISNGNPDNAPLVSTSPAAATAPKEARTEDPLESAKNPDEQYSTEAARESSCQPIL